MFFKSLFPHYINNVILLLFLVVSNNTIVIQAQSQQLLPHNKFERIATAEGLPNNIIYQVVKDNYGLIWAASSNGLIQYNGASFKVYQHDKSNPNSISHDYIRCLFKDKDGEIWIGTKGGGLCKYNYKLDDFTPFQYHPDDITSISHNEVLCITQDHKGNIWVGTESGLNRLSIDQKQFTRFKHKTEEPESIGADAILSIVEDSQQRLWIGTWGGGLNLAIPNSTDANTYTFRKFVPNFKQANSIQSDKIWTILEDDTQQIWLGSFGAGLIRMIPPKDCADKYFNCNNATPTFIANRHNKQDKTTLSNDLIFTLAQDNKGLIWVGTSKGLNIFNPKYLDKKNPTSAIKFQQFHHNTLDKESLVYNEIRDVYINPTTGICWLSSFGGIGKYDSERIKFELHLNKSQKTQKIAPHAVLEENNQEIWIGSTETGLIKYNLATKALQRFIPNKDNENDHFNKQYRSLYKDIEGNIWIGSAKGLLYFNKTAETFEQYPLNLSVFAQGEGETEVRKIYVDSRNVMWIGSSKGLLQFDLDTKRYTSFEAMNPTTQEKTTITHTVFDIIEDRNGDLWVATMGQGLFQIQRGNTPSEITMINHQPNAKDSNSLKDNRVLCLQTFGKELWIGTDNGFSSYDLKTKEFNNYLDIQALKGQQILSILSDNNGNLWMSSLSGLFYFEPQTGIINNFEVEDGLQDNKFNYHSSHKGKSGRLYFGGFNGLNTFYGEKIKLNTHVPKLLLTNLSIFTENIPVGQIDEHSSTPILEENIINKSNFTLSHEHSFFTIEFALPSYCLSQQNTYAYRLKNQEEDWLNLGNKNSISYTNLAPGKYTLEIKAANNDGIWTETPLEVNFNITPPYWKTWWFKLLAAFSISSLIWLLVRREINRAQDNSRRLEDIVRNRTQQLENASKKEKNLRLVAEQARSDAEEANKAKTVFLARMTHEIRTPMNPVINLTNVLLSENPSKAQRSSLESIQFSANHLMKVINHILDFSKIESGMVKLEQTPFRLDTLLKDIAKNFQVGNNIPEINIELSADLDKLQNQLIGSSLHIRQIFINLVGNALKFTKKGAITIQAKLEHLSEKTASIYFAVQDTGIGIPDDKIDYIFESFGQASESTTREYGGTGLGLTITKKLIELQGGNIKVKSVEKEGSTFYFTLVFPLGDAIDFSKSNLVKVPQLAQKGIEHSRILAAEDHLINQVVLRKILAKWNVELDIANNGLEVIEKMAKKDYDLLLMDIQMPKMDGYQATKTIREMEGSKSQIPIIALSAAAFNEMVEEAKDCGMNDHVSKPFNPEELFQKMDYWLKHSPKTLMECKDNYNFGVYQNDTTTSNTNRSIITKTVRAKIA
ncbi:MAG: two-component regulator propeller domain-containing protein [Chitinophagales bacterium]